MFPPLEHIIDEISFNQISDERKRELQKLIDYIKEKRLENAVVNLNFICTHNSRRSQFAQLWAKVAADYNQIPLNSYSGGVEVTAFNDRVVNSLKRFGFHITREGEENPIYSVKFDDDLAPLLMHSKLYDTSENPISNFAAVMTCSHADENCPFIQGCDVRIPIRYNDPKAFDDTPQEEQKYDERSAEIASEMFYVFSKLKTNE